MDAAAGIGRLGLLAAGETIDDPVQQAAGGRCAAVAEVQAGNNVIVDEQTGIGDRFAGHRRPVRG